MFVTVCKLAAVTMKSVHKESAPNSNFGSKKPKQQEGRLKTRTRRNEDDIDNDYYYLLVFLRAAKRLCSEAVPWSGSGVTVEIPSADEHA